MAVINVENLSKSYGKIRAVINASFSVDAGEIVGFIGPNGSGKTTALKTILDLLKPDSGHISICGHTMPKERVKAFRHIACWIDISNLYYDLTARDHIDFVMKTRGVPKKTVDKYLDLLDVRNFMDLKVRKYSYGMKQRLGLTLATMTEPELLIIDEPTNGLDPFGIVSFREVLRALSVEHNTAIFFSSHSLSELEKLIDRAIFIKKGEIVQTDGHSKNNVYFLRVTDSKATYELLRQNDIVAAVHENDEISFSGAATVSDVLSLLYGENLKVLDMYRKESDLEALFHSIFWEGE